MAIELTKPLRYNNIVLHTLILHAILSLKVMVHMALSMSVGAKKIKTPILLDSAEMEVIRALRSQGNISRIDLSNITG